MLEIPKQIQLDENYTGLTKEEVEAISTLKVTHTQYVKARNILVSTKFKTGTEVKKRDAGKLCRMDVNKSGKLFDFFFDNGWME